MVDEYRRLRQRDCAGAQKSSWRITVRQLESMIRLSESMARMHCQDEVGVINPSHSQIISLNRIKIYVFLNTEMVRVVKIFHNGRQGLFILLIHYHGYWHISARIFQSQHQKVCIKLLTSDVLCVGYGSSQGSILIFKATCPVGQVRLKIYLSCMKWHLSTQLYMLLSSDYWPVLSDKCHYNTTCPRSNFSKFLPVRDGRTKLKVEPCFMSEKGC